MKLRKIIAISVVAAAVASCSGTRDLTPAQLPELPVSLTPGQMPADSLSIADVDWWHFYNDSLLVTVINRTLDNNRDLQAARARVTEYERLYGIQRLNLAPEVSGVAGFTNETNDYYGGKDSHDLIPELKVTVAWEINLWGAQTWEKRRARANYLAEVERERAMRMSLVAEVASAYFRLIALRNELAIVQRTLQTRIESVEKARLRFEGGMTSEIVYQQAVVEYATTASLEPALKSRVAETRNAIALLMGAMPDDMLVDSIESIEVSVPADIPAGFPSTLLQRRPDIRMAEQQLAAALANVGVSYADRFPRLRIAVTGGFENKGFENLLRSPFSYTLGNIAGSILDFGRRKRRYQASIAAYDQARYAYEQSVLTAFGEVDNAITYYNSARRSARLKQELCNAALKYVTLAHAQYMGGSLAYIDVLDAQRRYFDSQIALSNAVCDECLALVNLYKALGGGWQ